MSSPKSIAATGRPRSLADDLRTRSDADLEALLSSRPDLLHPVPADVAQLAARAATSPSVNLVLDSLDRLQLDVCEAIAGLADPSTPAQLHDGLKDVPGYDKKSVDLAIAELRTLGLIWGHDLHLVRAARESFGAYPCGLGPAMSDGRRQVREYIEDPKKLTSTINSAPEKAHEILAQLTWVPHGTMKNANRAVNKEKIKSPLEWLLANELIVATGESTVVMPREISLALRGGRLLSHLEVSATSPISGNVDALRVNQTAAHNALDFVQLVECLLEEWSLNPPSQLRAGGLGARDFVAATEIIKKSEHETSTVIEVAYAAGLIAADDTAGWVPTTQYDSWLNSDDATRWERLAVAWHGMGRAPHIVGGESTDRINALSHSVERGFIQPLRSTVLSILNDDIVGSTATAADITAHLDWLRPRRSSQVRGRAVAAILQEAELIGVTGAGALSAFGRAVLTGVDAHSELAEFLPAPIDHIIVQADLTALAPGRLPATQRRTLNVIAEVESMGVATTYRFTESSIRRALDHGQSAHDVISFLTDLSKTPLPQPLTYLVDDVARKYGQLRVGVASVYLRCDDEHLMKAIQADKRLLALRLREIAPGIVVSGAPADIVLDKLRGAGYSPAAESAEGTVMLQRSDVMRTSSRPATPPVTVSHTSQRLVKAAVKALRAGEQANIAKASGEAPKTSTTEALNLLTDAMNTGRQVWIGYADRSGITTERIIEPLTIMSGSMTAFDLRSNEVKNFTIARITGAQYAEELEETK